jgi:hypothetical protein
MPGQSVFSTCLAVALAALVAAPARAQEPGEK